MFDRVLSTPLKRPIGEKYFGKLLVAPPII